MERSIVQKLIRKSPLITVVFLLLSSMVAAQTRRPAPPPASAITSYLPASDAVAIIDVKRALNETMPGILGGDAAKLAQANAEIDKFKTKTGVDLRSVDRFAISVRYVYPSPQTTKLDTVGIGHGNFNPSAVTASVRQAGNGQAREEKYRGATITIINVNDNVKMFGVWDMHVGELAVCVLDQNTIALGEVPTVRSAIDAGKAGRAPAALVALATHDPVAVAGFGANITPELLAKIDLGNDTLAKDVSSIKQAYGSLRSGEGNVAVTLVARTDSVAAAKNLSDTLQELRNLGGLLLARMTEPRKSLAESALNNLKVTARETELEIRTQVTAASLAALIK